MEGYEGPRPPPRDEVYPDELAYLEGVVERSQKRRRTWLGERKTSEAEAAESVLVAYAPLLIRAAKRAQRKS